jgi:SAM-dependent methyltransferase
MWKSEEDAFGQALFAQYNKRKSYEIIEREDGYVDCTPCEFYFTEYSEWPSIEKEALDYVSGRVLDIGCGAGRHALYLQGKGFDITGIDISPLAIQVCKLRGLKKAMVMSIDETDFESNSFDTIIMMGNNFGLFGDFDKAHRLLNRFYDFTSDDALLIAQSSDPYQTENPEHLEYHEYNRKRGRLPGQIRFRIRFRKYATSYYDYLLVSQDEMKDIVNGTGWSIKSIIGSELPFYSVILEK